MATRDRQVAQQPFDACDLCGTPFESRVSYPVETRDTADGDIELYSFCDEACRRAWIRTV